MFFSDFGLTPHIVSLCHQGKYAHSYPHFSAALHEVNYFRSLISFICSKHFWGIGLCNNMRYKKVYRPFVNVIEHNNETIFGSACKLAQPLMEKLVSTQAYNILYRYILWLANWLPNSSVSDTFLEKSIYTVNSHAKTPALLLWFNGGKSPEAQQTYLYSYKSCKTPSIAPFIIQWAKRTDTRITSSQKDFQ